MANKRTLTKAGAITSIVAWSLNILLGIYVVAMLAYVISIAKAAGQLDESVQAVIITSVASIVVSIGISILLLVFSVKILKFARLDNKEYAAKKGTILFVAIVNLLNVVYSIISMAQDGFDWTGAISILIVLGLLASAILILVDYSKNNKELQAQELAEKAVATEVKAEPEVVNPAPVEETVEDKLAKLNKMKADGLISEEEYNQMKADLLK